MELEITWNRAVKVWWSIFWRYIIAMMAAMVIAGIIGVVIGFVFSALGAPTIMGEIIAFPVSVILALLASIVPFKMILGKDYGEFRLVLLQNES
jgi:uncharacterized protein YacL